MKRVRLLYVGMRYDYGDPARGSCYEYTNFLGTLSRMAGLEVRPFLFDVEMRRAGRRAMNEALLRATEEFHPDVCFFSLFTDEIARETIRRITDRSGAVTLNWFGDDHWRFLTFSRHWAPLFHWAVTTDAGSVERYRAAGCAHVILSQWGFSSHLLGRSTVAQDQDVTFIGQVHSRRRSLIERLGREGIDVRCWGRGWPAGRISREEMVTMYSRSRINLNFTESTVVAGWKPFARVVLSRRADGGIHVNPPPRMLEQVRVILGDRAPQIKARNFEVTGAGGFLLTSEADHLRDYFIPGEEIAVFSNERELADRIRYYLGHAEEREKIREAGYRRAQREHTYEQRFAALLRCINVQLHGAATSEISLR